MTEKVVAILDCCAKCGTKLSFRENHLVYWNHQLRDGYISGDFSSSRKEFPEYRGKKLCEPCVRQEEYNDRKLHCLNPDGLCNNCGYFVEVRHERGGVDDLGTYFDESYSTFKCGKFSFDLKQDAFSKARQCTSYISQADYEKKCLSGEMDKTKQSTQINLDFSSLKEILAKGGMVMTTYRCPDCNGTLTLPEAGETMTCQYCGTSIKPVDIFQRIKSLIQ